MIRVVFWQTLVSLFAFVVLGLGAFGRSKWNVPVNSYVLVAVFAVIMVAGTALNIAKGLRLVSGSGGAAAVILLGIAWWCLCAYVALMIWANNFGT
jgi:hypothetical protein